MKDMMEEVMQHLKSRPLLSNVTIKSFDRPESIEDDDPSIVIYPMGPPKTGTMGSNTHLNMVYTYQINVETVDYVKTKEYASTIRDVLNDLHFHQLDGGLDEYFEETGRYVDARRYRGCSPLYNKEY